MPIVIVPTAFRGPTGGEGEIPVSGSSVLECLKAVDQKHPGFLALVLDESGSVHRFVKLFVNEQELDRAELEAPVSGDDRVEVLAAIGGG